MFGSFICPERDDQQENASDLAGLPVLEIAVRSFSGSSQQLPQVLTHMHAHACMHTRVCTHTRTHTHILQPGTVFTELPNQDSFAMLKRASPFE